MALPSGLVDTEQVRTFLAEACGNPDTVESLELSYMSMDREGPSLALYEAPGRGDRPLRVAARRVDEYEGPHYERMMNQRYLTGGGTIPVSGFPHPAIYARKLKLLFQIFPGDRRLHALPKVIDGHAMRRTLGVMLRQVGGEARLARVDVALVRYKPERKCLLRYDLLWKGPLAERAPRVVYGKLSRARKFARTHEILAKLQKASNGSCFGLPEPLGELPDGCLELISEVPGTPLSDLFETPEFPDRCREVASVLHAFHALPVTFDLRWEAAESARSLAENALEFAALLPREAARIGALDRTIRERLLDSPAFALRPIHRDFHAENVLIDGTHTNLVDFEECAMGEPAEDAAAMWGQLTWLAIKAGSRSRFPALGCRAFIEAYLDGADAEIRRRLPAFAAMHCFLYAYQCLRHPRGRRRPEQSQALLWACGDVLKRGLP